MLFFFTLLQPFDKIYIFDGIINLHHATLLMSSCPSWQHNKSEIVFKCTNIHCFCYAIYNSHLCGNGRRSYISHLNTCRLQIH